MRTNGSTDEADAVMNYPFAEIAFEWINRTRRISASRRSVASRNASPTTPR